MKQRACDQCLGTDTQYECERGQCYAEYERARYAEERQAEEEYWRRRAEEEGQA